MVKLDTENILIVFFLLIFTLTTISLWYKFIDIIIFETIGLNKYSILHVGLLVLFFTIALFGIVVLINRYFPEIDTSNGIFPKNVLKEETSEELEKSEKKNNGN